MAYLALSLDWIGYIPKMIEINLTTWWTRRSRQNCWTKCAMQTKWSIWATGPNKPMWRWGMGICAMCDVRCEIWGGAWRLHMRIWDMTEGLWSLSTVRTKRLLAFGQLRGLLCLTSRRRHWVLDQISWPQSNSVRPKIRYMGYALRSRKRTEITEKTVACGENLVIRYPCREYNDNSRD